MYQTIEKNQTKIKCSLCLHIVCYLLLLSDVLMVVIWFRKAEEDADDDHGDAE